MAIVYKATLAPFHEVVEIESESESESESNGSQEKNHQDGCDDGYHMTISDQPTPPPSDPVPLEQMRAFEQLLSSIPSALHEHRLEQAKNIADMTLAITTQLLSHQAPSSNIPTSERKGYIEEASRLQWIANGPTQTFIGELCDVINDDHHCIAQAEVVGFKQNNVVLMPFSKAPVRLGDTVRATGHGPRIAVGASLLGRVINASGEPIDGKGPLKDTHYTPLHKEPTNPFEREPIHEPLRTGIHAIDALLPLGKGQRIGLFAGSGVGKSVLLGLMAQHTESDVHVIALVGERGREVHDFLSNHLDEATLAKSVVVVSCSDDVALMRRQAVYTATTVAEYFCQQGQHVLLMVDSITRFAMAQREIGLSLNEPPTSRGYTPTVFSLLPGLIERAGLFKHQGSITALYTVLVEGDDFNEPIADAMRSLLDGHVVLTRELAELGHYPAIDVLLSLSRLTFQLTTASEQALIQRARALMSVYRQNKALIELGAYQRGHHAALDEAIDRIDALHQLLTQSVHESDSKKHLFERLEAILA